MVDLIQIQSETRSCPTALLFDLETLLALLLLALALAPFLVFERLACCCAIRGLGCKLIELATFVLPAELHGLFFGVLVGEHVLVCPFDVAFDDGYSGHC